MSLAGCQIIWLMPIFISKKVWKFLIKIKLTKSNPKRTRGGKCPLSCQLGLKLWKWVYDLFQLVFVLFTLCWKDVVFRTNSLLFFIISISNFRTQGRYCWCYLDGISNWSYNMFLGSHNSYLGCWNGHNGQRGMSWSCEWGGELMAMFGMWYRKRPLLLGEWEIKYYVFQTLF